METAHKRPNYILIWVYLAVLTAAELALAFELPISRNLKLLLLLFLATWMPGCGAPSAGRSRRGG